MTQIARLRWKVTNHVFNQSLLPSTWTVDSGEVFVSFFYKILNWIQSNYADSHGSLVTFLTNHCLFSMYNWKKFVCNTYIQSVTNNIQLFFYTWSNFKTNRVWGSSYMQLLKEMSHFLHSLDIIVHPLLHFNSLSHVCIAADLFQFSSLRLLPNILNLAQNAIYANLIIKKHLTAEALIYLSRAADLSALIIFWMWHNFWCSEVTDHVLSVDFWIICALYFINLFLNPGQILKWIHSIHPVISL